MDKDCVTQVQCLIKIIVKFRAKKFLSTFTSCTKHPFEGHVIMHEDDCACSKTIKSNELKIYISLKGNNLACSANS